jgi:hypothetical protein
MEHIKLAEEARTYKKCLADMDEMRATVDSASKFACSYVPNFQLQVHVQQQAFNILILLCGISKPASTFT